jgi:hypothetical protein
MWAHLGARREDVVGIQRERRDRSHWNCITGLSSSAKPNNNTMAGVCLRLKILAFARTPW